MDIHTITDHEIAQATAESPPTDPQTPSEHLARRVDQLRAKRAEWAQLAGTAIARLRRVERLSEIRRLRMLELSGAYSDLMQQHRDMSERLNGVVAALEDAESARGEVHALVSRIAVMEDEAARLRRLAAPEIRRRAKAQRQRDAAKRARQQERARALAREWREALRRGDIPEDMHRTVAREAGVTRAFAWIWTNAAMTRPRVVHRSYYHTNKSGDVVRSPNSYGYPTIYHPAVRELHVGRRWLRRHLNRLSRLACGLDR